MTIPSADQGRAGRSATFSDSSTTRPLPPGNGRVFIRANRAAIFAALVVFVGVVLLGGTLTSDEIPRGLPALVRIALHLPGPLVWLLSALGLGVGLWRLLMARVEFSWAFSLTLGTCAMLVVDAIAGSCGVFGIGSGEAAAALLLAPGILALWKCVPTLRASGVGRVGWGSQWPFLIAISPAVGVLALAAASAPGWLWSTEFGGYDALSYHLQLPREWLAAGRVETLGHNVYSAFPSYMECAFMHVMALRGGAIEGALDAQILHALVALVAAAMVGQLAQTCAVSIRGAGHDDASVAQWSSCAGWCAAGLMLGLPWVIVTGSLPYDEMVQLAALAGGLWLLARSTQDIGGRDIAWATAILCAGAMGAKLTSALMVVAPIAVLWVARELNDSRGKPRFSGAFWKSSVIVAGGTLALLAPWWARGILEGSVSIFPIVGDGPLTSQQARVFHDAHGPTPPILWWDALQDQYLLAGFGDAPSTDPWRPFWAGLPWIGVFAAVTLICRRSSRRIGGALLLVLAVQVALWLCFTHAKGRFLLPSAVGLAVMIAMAIPMVMTHRLSGRLVLSALVGIWCLQPLAMYEDDGPPGLNSPATGIGLEGLFTGSVPSDGIPSAIASLPPNARLVTLGAAAPFWWKSIPTYSTVWNDNPVAQILRENPGNPEACMSALRRNGWTHVLIDETMLDVWKRAGWLDPRIQPEDVNALARAMIPLRGAGGSVLFSIDPPRLSN